jgi:hypothetical protein
MFNALAPGPR